MRGQEDRRQRLTGTEAITAVLAMCGGLWIFCAIVGAILRALGVG